VKERRGPLPPVHRQPVGQGLRCRGGRPNRAAFERCRGQGGRQKGRAICFLMASNSSSSRGSSRCAICSAALPSLVELFLSSNFPSRALGGGCLRTGLSPLRRRLETGWLNLPAPGGRTARMGWSQPGLQEPRSRLKNKPERSCVGLRRVPPGCPLAPRVLGPGGMRCPPLRSGNDPVTHC